MYLGYDPMGKQFKVLCMTTTSSPYEVRDNTHQVLTLESGKKTSALGQSSIIVCFDVGSEKFSFINTNKDVEQGHSYRVYSLTLFNYKRYSRFVGMARTGEFVWSSSYNDSPNSFYLSFYSLESETLRKVKIQGFDEFKQHHRFISTYLDYVENVKWLM
ncbi:hypothetical protein DY000_02037830 [Brassica cretica]|uniref:F-box associated beta-propeller type 3 domain-containing protein n=1 Tax=Brassica cretica TaxID=69181 RepID=A0ABQ7B506_BRACR|nr:hypothetical protein DY000_02037830 [Brassica cretica]